MRSRTSSCEKTIFLKELTRFWPLWAAYLAVLLLTMPVALQGTLDASRPGREVYAYLQSLQTLPMMHLIITAIVSCLTAMAVYSFMYNARSVSFAASLPVRRGPTFLAHFLAGFCWLICVNVIAFGLYAAVAAAHGVGYIDAVLCIFLMNLLFILFFYGFASFCAVLTGNIIVLPLVYGVLNFTAVVVEFLGGSLLQRFVYGMPDRTDGVLTFLSPAVKLAENCGLHFENAAGEYTYIWNYSPEELPEIFVRFDGFITAGLYALAGVVFIVLALLIYRRRHMETAGDVVAVKVAKPIFRWCMTFGCALVIGTLFYQVIFINEPTGRLCAAAVAACMIAGAFIGYFASEMLMQKSFRVFAGKWPGYLVAVLVILVFVGAFEFDLFGYERRVPDAEDVQGVSLMYDTLLEEPENIRAVTDLHRSLIEHKERYDTKQETSGYVGYAVSMPVTAPGAGYGEDAVFKRTLRLLYTLKNGKTLERLYTIRFTEAEWDTPGTDSNSLEDLVNCHEAIMRRKETPVPVSANTVYAANVGGTTAEGYKDFSLTPQEAEELYACIAQDMDEGAIGRIWLCASERYSNTVYDGYISITLRLPGTENAEEYYKFGDFGTTPTKDAVHTDAFLREHGIELLTIAETRELNALPGAVPEPYPYEVYA